METKIPIKKLFRVALNSSTAIGFITLAPVYITFFYIGEMLAPQTLASIIKLSPFPPFLIALIATIFITVLIFVFWTINILFTYVLDKYSIQISIKAKYFLSYALCILAFVAFRGIIQLIVMLFFHSIATQKISYLVVYNVHYIELIRLVLISLFTLSANTIIFIIQNVMLLKQKETIIESENAQLKIMNIEATYQQLKQQIHPHFLFNSLNTLKTLINNNPDAEIFLKRLSDFLRTSITINKENTIKLSEELKFCMDYLELQKVRFGEALQFAINIPEEVQLGFVPVFSIQQLIENAIKHNALTLNYPLCIKVEYNNNRITVSNNIRLKITAEESTGVGLTNLAERYKILSGDEVVIKSDEKQFSVSIKILSYDNSNHRG